MKKNDFLEEFYPQNAFELTREISSFHRSIGSKSYSEAIKIITDFIKEYTILKYPLNKTYETWKVPRGFQIEKGYLKIINPIKKYIVQDVKRQPIRVIFFSGSSNGIEKLKVYNVGTGESIDDFPRNSHGNAVIANGNPVKVYRNARKLGVRCVLLYFMRAQDISIGRTPEQMQEAVNYTSFPSNSGGDIVGFAINYKEYIELTELTKYNLKIEFSLEINNITAEMEILEAEIGNKGFKKPIVLTAHLCHPKPGANDNASGSALLAEIIRVLKKIPLDRKIIALWIPEMYGTIAYINSQKVDFEYGINLDMVGEDQALTGSTLDIVNTPWSLPSFIGEILSVNLAYYNLKRNEGNYTGGSDHYIFNDSSVGIPFASLTQWPDKFYHSSEDTIDKASTTSFDYIGKGILNSLIDIAYGFDLISFAKIKAKLMAKYVESFSLSELSRIWLSYYVQQALEKLSDFGSTLNERNFINENFNCKLPAKKHFKNFKGPLGNAWMNEKDEDWEIDSQKEITSFRDFTYELLNFMDLGFSFEDAINISKEEFGIQQDVKEKAEYLIERLKEEKLINL